MIVSIIALFILLAIYYWEYLDIDLNDTLYVSSSNNMYVKVIDKNLINVTISSIEDTYKIYTLIFLIKYAKY